MKQKRLLRVVHGNANQHRVVCRLKTSFFILLLLALPVQAKTVSLAEAESLALAVDHRIKESEQLTEAARGLALEVDAQDSIQLESTTFLGLSPRTQGGIFEQPCGNGQECVVRDDRFDLSPGLSLWHFLQMAIIKPIYTFGKIGNYQQAADANIKVQEQQQRLTRAQVIHDVRKAYFGYQAARDSHLFLKDTAKRLQGALDQARNWLDEGNGRVKQSDVYALSAATGLVDSYISQAAATETIAMSGLSLLTNIAQAELAIADKRLLVLDLPEQDLQQLQQQALAQRPEMLQLQHGLQARRSLVAAEKAMSRPDIFTGVVGSWSYSPSRSRIDNPFFGDVFNDYGATPVIGLRWNWNGSLVDAKVSQEKAQLNALIEKNSLAQKGIPFEVGEAYYEAQALKESMAKLMKSAKEARRWMIASYADFEAGLEKADKMVTAFQAYVLAYTEYLKTVFNYNMKVTLLQQRIGAIQ